jgi:uncharacterized protein with GYD domain
MRINRVLPNRQIERCVTSTKHPTHRCPCRASGQETPTRWNRWSYVGLVHGTRPPGGSRACGAIANCLTVFLNRAYLGSGRVNPVSGVQVQRISQRETEMPMFITYASYSHSGAKGLIEKPEDRSGAIKTLVEKAGGKLIALYFTTGSNDVVLVSETADGSDAVAVGMAVAASGSLSKIETVRAWTPSEFKGIAEKAAKVAGAYTPPGK